MLCERSCRYTNLLKLTNEFDLQSLNNRLIEVSSEFVPNLDLKWDFHGSLLAYRTDNNIQLTVRELPRKSIIDIVSKEKTLASATSNRCPNQDELNELKHITEVYCHLLNHLANSNIDPLTSVMNRQAFSKDLSDLSNTLVYDGRRRIELPKYLALIDIDNFKQINDNYGHLLGDEVLVTFGQRMLKTFRDYDTCYRYGGEEFAVIMNDVEHKDAVNVLERFREIIADQNFPQVGQVTVSVGFSYIEPDFLPSELMGKADKALYYAKNNGKNQVQEYQVLLNEGKVSKSHHSDIEFW
ncbi:GGDEF domain-containing protein [Pleionea sediminis]|uniref:GGDEF domain-containing protein n=1 Tax=Pleionea sediminis TaxID=2569479 RepID=UPI001187265D|nr:GGDEF domain-containing protein [Pleionea sediminis]